MGAEQLQNTSEKDKGKGQKPDPVAQWLDALGTLEIVPDAGAVQPQTKGFRDSTPRPDGSTYQRIAYWQFVPKTAGDMKLHVMRGSLNRYVTGNGGDKPTPAEQMTVEFDVSMPAGSALAGGRLSEFPTAIRNEIKARVRLAARKAIEAKTLTVPPIGAAAPKANTGANRWSEI